MLIVVTMSNDCLTLDIEVSPIDSCMSTTKRFFMSITNTNFRGCYNHNIYN